jgi:hypothetical protein
MRTGAGSLGSAPMPRPLDDIRLLFSVRRWVDIPAVSGPWSGEVNLSRDLASSRSGGHGRVFIGG